MENQNPIKLPKRLASKSTSVRKPNGKKIKSKSTSAISGPSKQNSKKSSLSKIVVHVRTNHNNRHIVAPVQREKKDEYRVFSKNSLLKDIKNTAINGINQVFNSFTGILKTKSKTDLENYHQITNMPTPVKLYSPFTIETPSGHDMKPEERMRLRQQLFTSPRKKLKEDIEDLGKGINQLNLMVNKIPKQYQTNSQLENRENIENYNPPEKSLIYF